MSFYVATTKKAAVRWKDWKEVGAKTLYRGLLAEEYTAISFCLDKKHRILEVLRRLMTKRRLRLPRMIHIHEQHRDRALKLAAIVRRLRERTESPGYTLTWESTPPSRSEP